MENLSQMIDFLNDLKVNNNRDWFKANKNRYDESKALLDLFVTDIIGKIASFDQHLGDVKSKECVFRIYRDVRFSKNKDPYKTHFGAFIAKGGRKSTHPGYYIHIEPGNSFLGGGTYMPPPDQLMAIRKEIYYNPKEFLKILDDKTFKGYFNGLSAMGNKLKTAPKGFPKDFEHIDLLRNKSFVCGHNIPDKEIVKEDFSNYVGKGFQAMAEFNSYIYEAFANME